jgi:hypothetical protein
MSTSAGKAILIDSVKQLNISWKRCKQSWSDQAADRFEEDYLAHLEGATRQACNAIDRLQSACDEARRASE